MATAAYASTIRLAGTSTVITDEACTAVSSTVFQITDSTKRVLNPGVGLTVKANGVAQAVSAYTVDPLFGKVTFSVAPTAPVTITGAYLPMLSIAGVSEVSISESFTVLDDTSFGSAGVKTKVLGLGDVSGSLMGVELLTYDNDPGVGTQKLSEIFLGRTQTMLEIRPGGAGDYFRAWVLLSATDGKLPIDGRFESNVSFTGVARNTTGETGEGVAAGWGT